ncbi:MAG: cell division protein FtsW [Lentisphaeria bacterium]|nr:cell division protein FtsW [Lentisphaeria bacterium]
MLHQQEVVELINDINQRQDNKSFFYALAAGFIALLIIMFGGTMLYSTSSATVGAMYFQAQCQWAVIGLFAMSGVIFIGYRKLGSLSLWMMGLLAILLIWAAFFSPEVKGANRWIAIPGLSMRFQPSEFAKVALSIFGAKVASDNLRSVSNYKQLITQMWLPLGMILCILGLVACGKDLGTTLLLGAAMFSLFFSAGLPKGFLWLIPIAVFCIACYVVFFDRERLSRTLSFWNPGAQNLRAEDGYQLWNSWLALGSGGWFGIGFMESRMKQHYLPEAHTDFILAVVGEELGYIGIICVIAAYLAFGYFGMKIALNSRSRFGMLLAQTITLLIVLQAGVNIGVVSGALPTKGISAPMISYGGSNLLMNMIMVGLLVSVGLENVPGLTDNWPFRKSK